MKLCLDTDDEKIFRAIDSIEDLFIYQTIIKPALQRKIVILFVEGQSGEGKSMTCLSLAWRIEELFKRIRGLNYEYDPIKQVVYVPLEYNEKVEAWLKEPYLTLMIDELRFLLPKQKWYSLLNQSLAEANATLRAIKVENCGYGGVLIYNSQDIGDITKDARKTINFDIHVRRDDYSRVFLRFYEFWYDRSNVEKPIMRLRRVAMEYGGHIFLVSTASTITLPPTPIRRTFEEYSVEAKSKILKRKREIILKELKRELGFIRDFKEELQIDEIFEMVRNLASFSKKRGIYFTKQNREIICKMFDITPAEFRKQFLPAFEEECKRRGLI